MPSKIEDLPLHYRTPKAWAARVLENPLALLNDHAHLEKKAAANALDMLLRWPEPAPPVNWVQSMTSIAQDEVSHLQIVTRILSGRQGRLTRSHRNSYAAELRTLVRTGKGGHDLLDRLLVSALIELRSCERFALLAEASTDKELQRLYANLWKSEAGHYRVFLSLAEDLPAKLGVEARWEEMLREEAQIIQRQLEGPWMHSGG